MFNNHLNHGTFLSLQQATTANLRLHVEQPLFIPPMIFLSFRIAIAICSLTFYRECQAFRIAFPPRLFPITSTISTSHHHHLPTTRRRKHFYTVRITSVALDAIRVPRASIVVDEDIHNHDNHTTMGSTTSTENRSTRRESATTTTASSSSNSSSNRRAPHQFDHRTESARPFIQDVKLELQKYSNVTTFSMTPFDLQSAIDHYINATTNTTGTATSIDSYSGNIISHHHYQYYSLNELFPTLPHLSELFSSSTAFRNDIRNAIRQDIFYSTPQYQNMSEKAQRILLLPDSSIQGTWKCDDDRDRRGRILDPNTHTTIIPSERMMRLTATLQEYFGHHINITGDVFMETIGALCHHGATNSTPHDPQQLQQRQQQSHWIDIVGIKNRRVTHSWHQDTGRSQWDSHRKTRTVLWGFPCDDDYDGPGVFSHVIPLQREQNAKESHPLHVPILYDDAIVSCSKRQSIIEYIVRPTFRLGQEILVYSDTDVLHSAPDITYRTSCMRFM